MDAEDKAARPVDCQGNKDVEKKCRKRTGKNRAQRRARKSIKVILNTSNNLGHENRVCFAYSTRSRKTRLDEIFPGGNPRSNMMALHMYLILGVSLTPKPDDTPPG